MNSQLFNSYAEYIFSHFKGKQNGQGILFSTIDQQADKKFDISQKIELGMVLNVLIHNNYLEFKDRSQDFIILTQKGEDHLYSHDPIIPFVAFDEFLCSESNEPIKIFNVLWTYIGIEDALYFLKGPSFYNTIKPYLYLDIPGTYTEYMEELRKINRTSRIKWYRDLFLKLNGEDIKPFLCDLSKTINKEIKVLSDSDKVLNQPKDWFKTSKKVEDAENYAIEKNLAENLSENLSNTSFEEKPLVLLSYSWDSDKHKERVKNLAIKFRKNGIDAQIDEFQPYGADLVSFMIDTIHKSDKVLVILTPRYKEKAESGKGGASFEGNIISHAIYNQQDTTKFIPILMEGDFNTSCPDFMSGRKGFNFTDPNKICKEFDKLLKVIKEGHDFEIPKVTG